MAVPNGGAPVVVTVKAHITTTCGFRGPESAELSHNDDATINLSQPTLVSGSTQDGVWALTASVTDADEGGTYIFSTRLLSSGNIIYPAMRNRSRCFTSRLRRRHPCCPRR